MEAGITTYSAYSEWNYSACVGSLASSTMTYQSSSTTLPYPVVSNSSAKLSSSHNATTGLFGGLTK